MRKKITYVSPDNFFDVDFPVLKELSQTYKITWIAVFNQKPRFDIAEVELFASEYNIRVKCFERNSSRKSLRALPFVYRVICEINKCSGKLIYLEYFRDFYFILLSFFFLIKKQTVIAVHDVVPHKKIKNSLVVGLLDKIVFCHFDNFHLFSEVQGTIFSKTHTNKNIFIAPLMLKCFGPVIEKEIENEPIEFLFFGTINYYKGLDLLLNATTKLVDNGLTNFKLTIAGKGEYWDECAKLILHPKFYNCQIRFILNSEIPSLFSKAHYLVLPYRDVTQSGVLFASYFYNTPIIAPNFMEFKTYIDSGKNGYLYEEKIKEGLFDCLSKVIENHSNYAALQENLTNYKNKELSNNTTTKKYINFFQKIIKNEK